MKHILIGFSLKDSYDHRQMKYKVSLTKKKMLVDDSFVFPAIEIFMAKTVMMQFLSYKTKIQFFLPNVVSTYLQKLYCKLFSKLFS